MKVSRLTNIQLSVADLARAGRFYREALGFEPLTSDPTTVALRLGGEEIELIAHDPPGAPYPAGSRCIDLWFQHFAIVVTDMDAAYERLRAAGPFTAITRGAPQRVPPGAGSVTAFKFRDPDGHPLELLYFPVESAPPRWRNPTPGLVFLGIDHSAITVADTAASVAFYDARLGMAVTARSINQGPEQERLDDTPGAVVEVTALSPADPASPHVELLCYRAPRGGRPMAEPGSASDIAATRLVLKGDGSGESLRDPDGHRLLLTSAD